MAENENKGQGEKEKKKPWYRFPIKTLFKRMLYAAGAPVHDVYETDIRTMRVFVDLRSELDFEAIRVNNRRMPEIERDWDGVPGDESSIKNSASGIRDEITELFSKDGEFNSSIGPFTDESALRDEIKYVTEGTGTDTKSIEIVKPWGTQTYNFTIPKEIPIIYNDGRRYTLAFFGYKNPPYWDKLRGDVDFICEDIRKRYHGSTTDITTRNNVDTNLNKIKESVNSMINTVNEWAVKEFEEGKHYKNLSGTDGVEKLYKRLGDVKTKLFKKKLIFDKMYYVHTYKVIKPVIIQNGSERRLENEHGWYARADEAGPGLDKNGWPLEVGDGEPDSIFEGQPLEKGIVLLDLYNKDDEEYQKYTKVPKIRKVPPEFISEWSILDVAVWIFVSYDAYRDDLRDSRHHDEAITVMERILADINVKDMVFEIPGNLKEGEHIKTIMKLNKISGGPKLRFDSDPNEVEHTLTPSHLNPAFDIRAFKWPTAKSGVTKHLGRKLYYDVQDNVEKSPEPTISTRGAALYILHRIIERAKYWDAKGDPKKTGVMQLIDEIAKEIDGWDIGPNLGPGFARWGKPLTKNPFRPQQPG